MPVGAISQATGADLINALSQNAGQAQGVQSVTSMAALKQAISGENQLIQELLNATIDPGAPGGKLNVFA